VRVASCGDVGWNSHIPSIRPGVRFDLTHSLNPSVEAQLGTPGTFKRLIYLEGGKARSINREVS